MISKQQRIIIASIVFFVCLFILIDSLAPILSPFFMGALIAYLVNPIVVKLMQWHLSRGLATLIVFVVTIFILIIMLLILIPLIQHQVLVGVALIPKIFNWIQETIIPWINHTFGNHISIDLEAVRGAVMKHWQSAGNVARLVIQAVSHSGVAMIAAIANVLLIPVVTFYLLRDWHKVIEGTKKIIPRQIAPTAFTLMAECDEVIGSFFRGQLLVMLALGVIYATGLTIAGIELGLFIGIMAGLLSIVPYLGFIVGLLAAMLAAVVQFHDGVHLIYVLMIFGIGQVIEGSLLTPLLVGDKIGLHPVAVIFAILAFGQFFGFVGVLLALPVSAIIMVLVRFAYACYLSSSLYHDELGSK